MARVRIMRGREYIYMQIQKSVLERFDFFEHQGKAFDLAKDSDTAAFFLQQRLGKNLLTIRWVRHRLAKRIPGGQVRILFVAPTTPLIDLSAELSREGEAYSICTGGKSKREEYLQDENDWKLINYEALWGTDILKELHFDAIILDESVSIANYKAKATKAVFAWFKTTPIRAILSGLPTPESYTQIWTQMAFLHNGEWMGYRKFWDWKSHMMRRATYGYGWTWKPGKVDLVKDCVNREGIFMTRKGEGVGQDKEYEIVDGLIDKSIRDQYNECVEHWEIPDSERTFGMRETKQAVVVLTWLRKLIGGHLPNKKVKCWKYKAVRKILGECDGQIIVWFSYREEIDRMNRYLTKCGFSVCQIHGGVKRTERAEIVKDFRSGNSRVILIMETCGRYGLDLSCAEKAVYFSPGFSYNTRAQSEDRTEHVKKKDKTVVIDLVTRLSVDEDIQDARKMKGVSANALARRAYKNARFKNK